MVNPYLTFCNTWHVLAATVCLASGDYNIAPCPARAGSASTDNGNVRSARCDTTASRNVLEDELGDGDAARWASMKITAIVILLNENTIAVRRGQR
jgi:hypothetical protein